MNAERVAVSDGRR